MIAKPRSQHVCSDCGHVALTWAGQCPGCGAWNTLEQRAAPPQSSRSASRSPGPGSAAPKPAPLRAVEQSATDRLETGIGELDRVLGGGLMPGSLVLLGGAPGIGKSTLAAMATANLQASGRKVFYASGEESAAQIRLRAERLGEAALDVPTLAESSLEAIVAAIESEQPDACAIDSVQTLRVGDGAPGSVGAVREATATLIEVAKRLGVALILIGHVTKEGSIAGPRALEHLVDVVLHFEGERERTFRTLRAEKNRFGASSEVGVFEMRSEGLSEVLDPSAVFAGEARSAPGSCLLCAMEGSRPMLVEVQALVAPTDVVPPRRTATGIDRNRLALVVAVLSRHAGQKLAAADVFVNVAGGIRIDEPGADLAVAMAIVSARSGKPLGAAGKPLACFGEIGLTGEVRHVAHPDRRVAEARKFKLAPILGPPAAESIDGLEAVADLGEAIRRGAAAGGSRAGSKPRPKRAPKAARRAA